MFANILFIDIVSEFTDGLIIDPEIEYDGIPPFIDKDNDPSLNP